MQAEYFQMFDSCYNFQCSNVGHFFLQCTDNATIKLQTLLFTSYEMNFTELELESCGRMYTNPYQSLSS